MRGIKKVKGHSGKAFCNRKISDLDFEKSQAVMGAGVPFRQRGTVYSGLWRKDSKYVRVEEHQAAQCFFSIKSEEGSSPASGVALEKLEGNHRGPRESNEGNQQRCDNISVYDMSCH